jgi:MoxR-like ATPase
MVTESKYLPEQTDSDIEHDPNTGLKKLFQDVLLDLQKKILGQPHLSKQLLVALLSDGHLLVEGAPGLAKTRAIKSLAELLDGEFHRVQFTPDLLPSDLTGTEIYQPENASFSFQKGPLFHNLVLADEINRAPAKVQSALLEAMAERQITIGRTTHHLPQLFMVMATQNPIEQEGTYPLPEAQLDRFLLQVNIDYPDGDVEKDIVELAINEAREILKDSAPPGVETETLKVSRAQISQARTEVLDMYMSPSVKEYIVQLVLATRKPSRYAADLADSIEYGASPRGTIGLDRASRAHAWLSGKDYVSPDDVQKVLYDTLRHRIILSFTAEAQGLSTDDVISRLVELVPVP